MGFKCPWTYTPRQGGGTIVQRFGTPLNGPPLWPMPKNQTYRSFGLQNQSVFFDSGVHNVFYRSASASAKLRGQETLSLFVNDQDGASAAYEFVFKPRHEGINDPGDDTVFSTEYVHARCHFEAFAEGGARAIGDGVFIVASGKTSTFGGFEINDAKGGYQLIPYGGSVPGHLGGFPVSNYTGVYDPFIRVVKDSEHMLLI